MVPFDSVVEVAPLSLTGTFVHKEMMEATNMRLTHYWLLIGNFVYNGGSGGVCGSDGGGSHVNRSLSCRLLDQNLTKAYCDLLFIVK